MGIVAAVQSPPVYCDSLATAMRAAERIGEAARAGAWLAVFAELYIPDYPEWPWRIERRRAACYDMHPRTCAEERLHDAAPIAAAASGHDYPFLLQGVHLVPFSRHVISQ